MQVIGHNLGSDKSTLYITEAGDFLLYPTLSVNSDHWVVLHYMEGVDLGMSRHRNRSAAIKWIDTLL